MSDQEQERDKIEPAGPSPALSETDAGDPEHTVSDEYVAQRVRAYRAATAEANRLDTEAGLVVGTTEHRRHFGRPILLGLLIAILLLILIHLATGHDPERQPRPPTTSASPLRI